MHITLEHVSRLTVQMDGMWLVKRSLTSLSFCTKVLSGILHALKSGNGISKIYVITLNVRQVAHQKNFSHMLSES